ncbi:MAG: DUF1735 and LamG domain-containing protein [Rikenellaceae bacterium]|jgi:hypothetical protein|nr:DUF1735 and LamG domain-containing protein [Rikenellaceae bacterium]
MKKHIALLSLVALIAAAGCKRVNEEDHPFNNQVYIQNAVSNNTVTVTLKSKDAVRTMEVQSALALPVDREVNITYAIDLTLVETYGRAHNLVCEPLADTLCSLSQNTALIPAGDVRSTVVTVDFVDLNVLKRGVTYVLPVTIKQATGMGIMSGARTIYYVLSQGATINTVPYMGVNYFKSAAFTASPKPQNLTKVTFEALIHPRAWKSISSIMGVEDYFLIRVGDTFPVDQLQLAHANGNSQGPKLTAGKWQHLAMTYDHSTSQLLWYIDGVLKQTTSWSFSYSTINLGDNPKNSNDFYVGYSYEASRWFDGEMSEVRVWNVVRTQQEIVDNIYEVDPATPGLVAYWKCDEGAGKSIRDYSPNGLNAEMNAVPQWVKVSLPLQ